MTTPTDDALAELRHQFREKLPARLADLREHFARLDLAHWQPDQLDLLHRLVHGLTGAAGSFGLQSVSLEARDLEEQLAALIRTGGVPCS